MDLVPSALQKKAPVIEEALERFLPRGNSLYPRRLLTAMRYAVFSGGKRIRPFLVLEASEICGGGLRETLPLACAVEMIHSYSLVHDDLPSMDDAKLRRGKKTCHLKFDEATAILAGDALLSHAFQVISDARGLKPDRKIRAIRTLAEAVGPYGMITGQILDLKFQHAALSLKTLERINRFKTACLIRASVETGAIWGGGAPWEIRRLRDYGERIGFLFQLVDDIIDQDGTTRFLDRRQAYERASRLRDESKRDLEPFKGRARVLVDFADYLLSRTQ